jgi:NAD(P)H-nitrite reductase large subunit
VGLKAAEALASRGLQVRLLEQEARPLSRLLDPVAEDLLIAALKEKHLDLYLQSWPEAILEEKGRVAGVALNGHRELKAQAVLFAVGVEPRVDFLADTGIASPEGIRVDPFMHTAAPDIYAAGDCCLPHHLLTGQPAAFYIWPAAVAQGQVAGANLAGAGRRYDGILPQNSISLKGFRLITGGHLNPDTGDGEVFTQLDRQHRRYRRLVFQDGRLVGVTLVGQVSEAGLYFHLISRKLPVAQLPIDLRSPDFQPGRLWG